MNADVRCTAREMVLGSSLLFSDYAVNRKVVKFASGKDLASMTVKAASAISKGLWPPVVVNANTDGRRCRDAGAA